MKKYTAIPRFYEYQPLGYHLNDFALIRKGIVWHLFHITGRGLKGGPGLCNESLALGHATTTDFIRWTEQPAIPEASGACYVVRHKGRYGLIFRQGSICWSRDLFHWSKPESLQFINNPARWYDRCNKPEEARYIGPRDPFIMLNPETNKYLMVFCDRTEKGDVYNRGCVGAAESEDLVHWTYLPPVFGPKHFYCESPHIVPWGGKYHLFFSLSPEAAVRHAVSEQFLGPYRELGEGNILPAYHGAGDAIQCDKRWLYFGRVMEREEHRNKGRLIQGRLSLPVEMDFGPDDRVSFAPYRVLTALRGKLLVDGFRRNWRIHHGDWRFNLENTPAQNLYTEAPAGAVLGSAYFDDAEFDSTTLVGNFDLECRFQLPTFSFTAGVHFRAGLLLRGCLRLEFDALLQTALLSDATGTVLCTAPLQDFQLDRYYDLRIIYLGNFIQVYLNNRLLMYLCVYGPDTGPTALIVWQGDAIFASLKIYQMPESPPVPVFPGGEPLFPGLP
ncbi:MAG: hypothetical protein WC081_07145 [Candidatus Ratteibacteria bacterium]|jgi:hypothetical protein